jgi:hypothetical protein
MLMTCWFSGFAGGGGSVCRVLSSLPGRLTDHVALGLLTGAVPRDVVDTAIAVHGRRARRSGGSLPPHVMVYFAMAMALFAEDDYEGVLAHLSETLARWGCWEDRWSPATSGGIAQARVRLGFEPVKEVFERVAVPVADALTRGAWCGGLRLVSVDGMVFDLPDSPANAEAFGYPSGGAFPQARVVTLTESGSHCTLGAHIGPVAGKGTGERTAARELFTLLGPKMLFTADRGFYSFDLWCAAAATGAQLLWRIGDTVDLPAVADLGDGSYLSVLFAPRLATSVRQELLTEARDGSDLAEHADKARLVRVIEYYIDGAGPDQGDRELIVLLTTITDPNRAIAGQLAEAYHSRWEHEGANDEIKTELRGPGRILRSKHPDMARQEIYGYLLTHYAITALICTAATEADTDPDRVKFVRTVRLLRRRINDPAAFSP